MQLIWVSGPTARVVTLSITRDRVLGALALAIAALLLLGGVFQWIGLRVAVELAPGLVQTMGGVASRQEQQRAEAAYSAQLAQLQQELGQTVARLQQIESNRQAFFARIGLAALAQPSAREGGPRAARGGPLKPLPLWSMEPPVSLADQFSDTASMLGDVRASIERTHEAWSHQQGRLEALPLALPIEQEFMLSSSFGIRPDPMTHLPSMHEGIDFVAPAGTPVVVTAAGQVVRARPNGAYGNMVEVSHAEGFVTRYAHLQSILVQPGQALRAGDRVGLLGNTGRSTGPHLHYEVLYRGQAMHPVKAMQSWSRS
jgi:murein DD-endopeptidase MepM/ murein hydrolase activator NlpD